MSQQEFFQQPKKRNKRDQNAESASTYYRKSADTPKEEHPSTFEDVVPPYAYRAQDAHRPSAQSAQDVQGNQPPRNGAPFARGYRSSARYQRSDSTYRGSWQTRRYWQHALVRWAVIILLIFLLIHILPFLASVLLVIVGILAAAFLIPIFIFFGIIATIAIITLIVMRMLGIPVPWRWLRSRIFGQ